MKSSAAQLARRLPGKPSEKWPAGERFAAALAHALLSVEFYAPAGTDPQTPHLQDELHVIQSGTGVPRVDGRRPSCETGRCLFVVAGTAHRFESFSADVSTGVVFRGPPGGEPAVGSVA